MNAAALLSLSEHVSGRSGKRSGAGRKSAEREWSADRTFQKIKCFSGSGARSEGCRVAAGSKSTHT